MRVRRRFNIAFWAPALFYVFFVLPTVGQQSGGSDFERMWRCAKAVKIDDVGDLYTPTGNKAMTDAASELAQKNGVISAPGLYLPWVQTTFTPALLTAFALASSNDMRVDSLHFHYYAKIAFGLGALALAAALEIPIAIALITLVIVGSTSHSFLWVQRWGNVECLQVGLFAATTCLLRGRRPALIFIAGAILGLIAAAKPTAFMPPVFLGVTLLATRRWEALFALGGGLALSALIAGALPTIVLGGDVGWRSWLSFFRHFNASSSIRQDKSAFFAEIFNSLGFSSPRSGFGNLIGIGLTAAVAVFWAWASKKEVMLVDRFPQDAAALTLGTMLFLLCAPFVFGRYFLFAMPATLVAIRLKPPSLWAGRAWIAAAVLALYLSGNPAWTDSHDSEPAGVAYAGVVLLFAMLGIGRYFASYFDKEPVW